MNSLTLSHAQASTPIRRLIRAYDTLIDRFQEDPQRLRRLISRGHAEEAAALASSAPLLVSELALSFASGSGDTAFRALCHVAQAGHDLSPALPTLIGSLGNRDPETRRQSAALLGMSSKTTDLNLALPFLFGLLKDPDDLVREAAINSLAEFAVSLKNSPFTEAMLVNALSEPAQVSDGAARAIILAMKMGNLNLHYRLEGTIFNYNFPPRWE